MSHNNALQGSAYSDFLTKSWPIYANQLDSLEVEANDFILCITWVIDSLRDHNLREQLLADPWNYIRSAIRTYLHSNRNTRGKEDTDLFTQAVCGHALYCWGFMMRECAKDYLANRESYMSFIHNLGQHWCPICEIMNSCQYDNLSSLCQWLATYIDGIVFYTCSDEIEWDVEATGIIHVPVATSQHPVNVNINIETFNNHPGATFNDNSTALQPSADNQKLLK